MASNARQDKYEAIGAPPTTADILSGTPIGGSTVPPADDRVVHTPVAAGVPAPVAADAPPAE